MLFYTYINKLPLNIRLERATSHFAGLVVDTIFSANNFPNQKFSISFLVIPVIFILMF